MNIIHTDRFVYLLALLLLSCFTRPLFAATIDVTGLTDNTATCVTNADPVSCPSLRSAIIFANNNSGADSITLEAGQYVLSIDGVDETWSGSGTAQDPYIPSITPDATTGDLDITDSIVILGAADTNGRLLTTIRWDEQSTTDPAVGDRIFHVQALTGGAPISVSFSQLILTNGSVGVVPNTDPATTTNPYDIEVVNNSPGATVIRQFRRMGGAVAVGSGASVVVYQEAAHGPGADPGDGTPGGPFPAGPGDPDIAGVIERVSFHRVAVVGNFSGADGGGIYNAATAVIRQSVLSGNSSGRNGGGIYSDAEIIMSDTTVGLAGSIPFLADASLTAGANTAVNGGGVFDTGPHSSLISRSSINGNAAIYGGAIVGHGTIRFNIVNTTISGNVAVVGAGITSNGASIITNSNISYNNNAVNSGGAGVNAYGPGTFTLVNTILSINELPSGEYANCDCGHGVTDCPQIISLGNNLESCQSCGFDPAGTDRLDTFPLLKPLANNGGLTETHALPHTSVGDAEDSPAVDTGDPGSCPGIDQRGVVRPADGNLDGVFICDVGPFELTAAVADLHISSISKTAEWGGINENVGASAVIVNPAIASFTAENVVASATLPAGLSLAGATLTNGATTNACSASGNTVTCPAIPSLAPGQQAILTIETTTVSQGFHPLGFSVTSIADPIMENNSATVYFMITGRSDLALAASADTTNVATGSNVTITLTAANNGPDEATATQFTGVVPNGFALVSVTPSIGSCATINTGIHCDLGALAPSAAATAVVVLRSLRAGTFDFNGQVVSDQTDLVQANNIANLAITATGNDVVNSPSPASSGGGGGGGSFAPVPALVLGLFVLYLMGRRWTWNNNAG